MSSHNQQTSPSFISIVLVLTFVIVLGIISFGAQPPTIVHGTDDSTAIMAISTDAPVPTETPMPPTSIPTEVPTLVPTVEPTATFTLEPTSTVESASSTTYDSNMIAYGQTLFAACSACHGADGLGIPNLGKDLVDSEFVHSLTDDELVDFIKTGRPMWDADNTTGIDMPAKGGNPALSDDDILAIVSYIRTLSNDSSNETSADTTTESEETASASTYDTDTIAYGQTLFAACSACHGADGLGIPNLGKDLVDSEFVHSLTDDELVDFIKTGRPMWDADNTTGIDMPAKGGNPALSDDDILAIVSYIRSLSE